MEPWRGFCFGVVCFLKTFIKSHHLLQYILHLDSERWLYFAYIINLIDIIYITVLCLLMLFLWSKWPHIAWLFVYWQTRFWKKRDLSFENAAYSQVCAHAIIRPVLCAPIFEFLLTQGNRMPQSGHRAVTPRCGAASGSASSDAPAPPRLTRVNRDAGTVEASLPGDLLSRKQFHMAALTQHREKPPKCAEGILKRSLSSPDSALPNVLCAFKHFRLSAICRVMCAVDCG